MCCRNAWWAAWEGRAGSNVAAVGCRLQAPPPKWDTPNFLDLLVLLAFPLVLLGFALVLLGFPLVLLGFPLVLLGFPLVLLGRGGGPAYDPQGGRRRHLSRESPPQGGARRKLIHERCRPPTPNRGGGGQAGPDHIC